MATLTAEKPLVTANRSSVRSSTQLRDLPATESVPAGPVEVYDSPIVSTAAGPAELTVPKVQVFPEQRRGFLSRMVHMIRDVAFQAGIGSPGRPLYRNSQALSPREKAEHDAALMGFPQF